MNALLQEIEAQRTRAAVLMWLGMVMVAGGAYLLIGGAGPLLAVGVGLYVAGLVQ